MFPQFLKYLNLKKSPKISQANPVEQPTSSKNTTTNSKLQQQQQQIPTTAITNE